MKIVGIDIKKVITMGVSSRQLVKNINKDGDVKVKT